MCLSHIPFDNTNPEILERQEEGGGKQGIKRRERERVDGIDKMVRYIGPSIGSERRVCAKRPARGKLLGSVSMIGSRDRDTLGLLV